ncbi:MAG TPA: HyaD/HybD family hydrogenase maturation endopeptidase [Spirochaetota bacterium]|nr:HyaD/HybD family hydrogenase maturation endopeptidase [Spirochaetota bacterium]
MKNVLILGIGNILQSDDGLGVHIVNEIIDSGVTLPDNVEIVDGGTAGFDLIPLMQGKDRIIIVDALGAADEPGSVYRLSPEQCTTCNARFSLHEVGIMQVLRTLRLLGDDPLIEIIGIVPRDVTTLSMNISEPVRRSIPVAVKTVLEAALQ